MFDSLYDGVLIIDEDEVVVYVNTSYTRITKVDYEKIVGNKLRDVRLGARLPNVLKSKKPIVGALREENGIEYVVNMSPIMVNGRLEGAISVVTTMNDAFNLTATINRYQKKISKLEDAIKTIHRAKYKLDDIISEDRKSQEVKKILVRIAKKNTTVLISGESGTGKEMAAQAIHNASPRANGPFIAVNCASFHEGLLESELFGYEEGSFTGAKKDGKLGLFEAADEGTIFLDEVSEMGPEVQAKLLRTLQERTVRRIGGVREIPIDVRVLTATNRDLEKMVEEGSFRQDLFYRLSVFPLQLPPLRERRGDIIPLAESFLLAHKNDLKKEIIISEDAKEMLMGYGWPGNIRELKNSIEFAVNMIEEDTIKGRHLPIRVQSSVDNRFENSMKLATQVKSFERNEIMRMLEIHGKDIEGKRKVANLLGISLASLYNKIK